jgi:hypothetical protein
MMTRLVRQADTSPLTRVAAPVGGWADPDELTSLHAEASDAAGLIEHDYGFAGVPVRVRYCGSALLQRVGPAIAHLETPRAGSPALVLNVWDSRSTHTRHPDFPEVEPSRDGERARYYAEANGVRASYQPSNGMLSVLDSSRREAWYWAEDAAALPYLDAAEPMRQILHWWLGDRGVQMLHGSAVGTAEGGVLCTGKNGSGKSTAALASLGSTLRYAGDDYVAVEAGRPPHVYSLYNSGKLERHHARRFQDVLTKLPSPDDVADDKAVVFINELYPQWVITEFPLRAIVVPRVTERRLARLVPTHPAVALAALAPTTLLQHHPPQPNALPAMSALVQQVPTLALELGSDLKSISETILGFLKTTA